MYELKRQFSTVEYREKTHVYQTGGSGLGRAHLPSIKKEHIVEVYDMFDI